jgi:uncharacterized protein YjgD (DUF1641 family)
LTGFSRKARTRPSENDTVNIAIMLQLLSGLLSGATKIVELIKKANAEKRDISIAELAELTRADDAAKGLIDR